MCGIDATLSELWKLRLATQGSSFLATLGWMMQSRWDCGMAGTIPRSTVKVERNSVAEISMRLFSSVIHVRDASADSVCAALAEAVPNWNFKLSKHRALTERFEYGPEGTLQYLVSPLEGRWSTILESHGYIEHGPWLSDLAKSLSAILATHTLTLMVHDDDVLFYNLCLKGNDLDGYNSNPQYFESARLPDDKILEQRHDPLPFRELLPDGVNLDELLVVP